MQGFQFITYIDVVYRFRRRRTGFINVRRYSPTKLKSALIPRRSYAKHNCRYDVVAAAFRYVHALASHSTDANRKKWSFVEDRLLRRYATYHRHKTHDRL